MGIIFDDELADSLTRSQFERDKKLQPETYDFYYYPTFGGKKFEVRWSKDINVTNPQWHIIVSEV